MKEISCLWRRVENTHGASHRSAVRNPLSLEDESKHDLFPKHSFKIKIYKTRKYASTCQGYEEEQKVLTKNAR